MPESEYRIKRVTEVDLMEVSALIIIAVWAIIVLSIIFTKAMDVGAVFSAVTNMVAGMYIGSRVAKK